MKYEKPVLKVFFADEARGLSCYNGSTAAPDCSYGGNVDATCYGGSGADPCSGGGAPIIVTMVVAQEAIVRTEMGTTGTRAGKVLVPVPVAVMELLLAPAPVGYILLNTAVMGRALVLGAAMAGPLELRVPAPFPMAQPRLQP